MGRIKKFTGHRIRKITGGKDPVRLVEDFIKRQKFNPDSVRSEDTPDTIRWVVDLGDRRELEILVESLRNTAETTVYFGVNVAIVPIRGVHEFLAAALEIADGLIGIKVSLVNHFLVLSASLGAAGLSVDELNYHYKLITAQQDWFREALAEELGWEDLPTE